MYPVKDIFNFAPAPPALQGLIVLTHISKGGIQVSLSEWFSGRQDGPARNLGGRPLKTCGEVGCKSCGCPPCKIGIKTTVKIAKRSQKIILG